MLVGSALIKAGPSFHVSPYQLTQVKAKARKAGPDNWTTNWTTNPHLRTLP